jgi:cytochrome c peroxidase
MKSATTIQDQSCWSVPAHGCRFRSKPDSHPLATGLLVALLTVTTAHAASGDTDSAAIFGLLQRPHLPNNLPLANASGFAATHSTAGRIDLTNAFFQDLGSNGRRCVSCHQPQEGWAITPAGVRRRFNLTRGTDPIFRTNDGANSPNAEVSTVAARRSAYSMLLRKGLIRVGLPVPANAEFELVAVDDPYGFASAAELSLFRRPLPSTNLKFLSAVMWDGRETFPGKTMHFNLGHQANEATRGHAMGESGLTAAQIQSIVKFETALTTAQVSDRRAGNLTSGGAKGGPVNVARQKFYIGINDNFGDSRTRAPFNPVVFDLYDAWTGLAGTILQEARASVARGQAIFNTHPIQISGVSGINDEAAFGNPETVTGTCTTCHNTPNGGNHSVVAPLNIGLSDASRRTPDMPLYTFRNKATGEIVQTTDPGRALISGKWKHIGRFKGPILRALAPRPPYFHNGFAKDLGAVVDFYDDRFGIGLTSQERADLIAFLRTL